MKDERKHIKRVMGQRDPSVEIKFCAPKTKLSSPAKRWAESVAIVPKGVKKQVLPGYTGAPAWDMRGKTWGRT